MRSADIIIVGGGIIGNAIASYLAQKVDARILLVEQNQLCSGSTSFSASLATRVRNLSTLIPLADETHRAVSRLSEKFKEKLGVRRVGCLHIAMEEKTLQLLENIDDLASEFGIDSIYVHPRWVKKVVPWLETSQIAEALFIPDEFYIDGNLFGVALAREARFYGVEFLVNTRVVGILTENGKVKGIRTVDAEFLSPVVIDAAGVWSNLLLQELGFQAPYAAIRSLYFLTTPNPDLYPSDQPICILPDAHAFARPQAGALVIGIRDSDSPWTEYNQLPFSLNEKSFISECEEKNILEFETSELRKLMIDFDKLKFCRSVAAPSAYSSDGYPIIGPVGHIEGLYIATGCSGSGIAMGAGFGRIISELISGEKPFTDISEFDPDRFTQWHPGSVEFMKQCSEKRSGKKSG